MPTAITTPPTISTWPDTPTRTDPDNFPTKAEAFLGHWVTGQSDQAALVAWLNTNGTTNYNNAVSAEAEAAAALSSAADSAASALDAAAVANNKGNWAALTGALNVPASVNYNGSIWVLNVNLANVAASAPSSGNTDWTEIKSFKTIFAVGPYSSGVTRTSAHTTIVMDNRSGSVSLNTLSASDFYFGDRITVFIPYAVFGGSTITIQGTATMRFKDNTTDSTLTMATNQLPLKINLIFDGTDFLTTVEAL